MYRKYLTVENSASFGTNSFATTDGLCDDLSVSALTRPIMWTKWQTKLPFRGERSYSNTLHSIQKQTTALQMIMTKGDCFYFPSHFQFTFGVESELAPILQDRWIDYHLDSCVFIILSQCKLLWLYK